MAFTHALIVDGLVRQLFEADPNLPDPWHVMDVTAFPDVAEGWVLGGDGNLSAPLPPTPAPVFSISRAQAKIQLLRTKGSAKDKTLLDDVTAAVDAAGGEVKIWFADAAMWQRTNPYIAQIGKAVGLSDKDTDKLFQAASQIDA